MKSLFPALLFFLFVPLPLFAEAEKEAIDFESLKHPLKPALFRVEGAELKKPSYLFGTIHLGDPRVTTLHPEAEKAFEKADRFYAEIDLDPAKQIAAAIFFLRQDGKTLTDSIGPELTGNLANELKKISPALSPQALNPLKTWATAVQLPLMEQQLKGRTAMDAILYQRAQEAGKKVAGLETIESQTKIFDDLDEKAQIALLRSTMGIMAKDREEGEDSVQEMVELYLTGNVPEIGKLIAKMIAETNELDEEMKEVSADLLKKLLPDRNRSMSESIASALKEFPEESHFFAVGAGHYSGDTAIQKLLAQKGYTVTPLFK